MNETLPQPINKTNLTPNNYILDQDKNWLLCLLSVSGSLISIVPDAIKNGKSAALLSISLFFETRYSINGTVADIITLLIVIFTAIILCIVYMPKTRLDAFIRGAATLVILTTGVGLFQQSPGPSINDISKEKKANNKINESLSVNKDNAFNIIDNSFYSLSKLFVSCAHAQETKSYFSDNDSFYSFDVNIGNATIIKNDWISNTKPSYRGLFGFLGDTIDISKMKYTLDKGKRVRIVDNWTTNRGDKYIKIQYWSWIDDFGRPTEVRFVEGWIWAGNESHPWSSVMPDDTNNPISINLIDFYEKMIIDLEEKFKNTASMIEKKKLAKLQVYTLTEFRVFLLNPFLDAKSYDRISKLSGRLNLYYNELDYKKYIDKDWKEIRSEAQNKYDLFNSTQIKQQRIESS